MNRWRMGSLVGSVVIAAAALAPVPVRAQNDAPPPPAEKSKASAPTPPDVTLDLRDAPLRQALEQLFSKEKVDYSLDNSIQGYVTLKLTEQPFENALRLLLHASPTPLTYRIESGVYIVQPRRDRATSIGIDDSSLLRPDASNQIVAGGSQFGYETIQLTYLDPADVAQLLNIIIIPTFSRQGARTTIAGGGGTTGGASAPGAAPTQGTGNTQSPLPIAPGAPIRISQ